MLDNDQGFVADFPEFRERIRELQSENSMFAQLLAEYEKLNAEIHQIDSGILVRSDDYIRQIANRCAELKKKLYSMLRS